MPKIFLISDLHFGHRNIIGYSNRPFLTAWGMDRALVKNWNETVGPEDRVFYLGDFVWRGPIGRYIRILNGKKTFIRGNHDGRMHAGYDSVTLAYQGREFLLVHDPADVPESWKGWVIHGHHHNSDTEQYPFINPKAKRINVSCELIGYRPIDLDLILSLDLDRVGYIEKLGPRGAGRSGPGKKGFMQRVGQKLGH